MTKHMILLPALLLCSAVYAQKKVLFVMSAADTLPLRNGKIHPTGVFLSEFYPVYSALKEMGYEADFATPAGQKSPIDPESLDPKYWKREQHWLSEAKHFTESAPAFIHPATLEEAYKNAAQYAAIIIPGGQGLMTDLIRDKNIPKLLAHFSAAGKPVGLICHAPVLMLSFPEKENPFNGYRFSSVTRMEEFFIERFVMKGKPANRKIARQLQQSGLKHRKGRPAGNFAIRDRELITSQNPYSNKAFIQLFTGALKEYERKGCLKP